jgi:hypothetical protein
VSGGATLDTVRARIGLAQEAEARGEQPVESNIDWQEARRMRERWGLPSATGSAVAAPARTVPPASTNGRPLTVEDTARQSLLVEVLALAGALPAEDLHALVKRLQTRTDALTWGERMRLRSRRDSVNRSAEVGGTKVHVGVHVDDAGDVREVWIDVAKEGSPVRGMLHAIAGLASIALQHGAPPHAVAKVMSEPTFDPSGEVTETDSDDGITMARSIPDYVAQVVMLGRHER